jgi:hypothetical protein
VKSAHVWIPAPYWKEGRGLEIKRGVQGWRVVQSEVGAVPEELFEEKKVCTVKSVYRRGGKRKGRGSQLTTRGPAADGLGGILEISYVGKALFW